MKKIFNNIREFFFSQRRSGTTSLLKEIAENHDVYVLVPYADNKKEFGDKALSYGDLEHSVNLSKKPILVDNQVMLDLCEQHNNHVKELESSIKDRDILINSIHVLIRDFEHNKPQYYMALDERNGQKLTYFHKSNKNHGY